MHIKLIINSQKKLIQKMESIDKKKYEEILEKIIRDFNEKEELDNFE